MKLDIIEEIQIDKTMDYIFMGLNMLGIESMLEINEMLEANDAYIPIYTLAAYMSQQLKIHCLYFIISLN